MSDLQSFTSDEVDTRTASKGYHERIARMCTEKIRKAEVRYSYKGPNLQQENLKEHYYEDQVQRKS